MYKCIVLGHILLNILCMDHNFFLILQQSFIIFFYLPEFITFQENRPNLTLNFTKLKKQEKR